jgi:hypothetical protein
MPRFGVLRLLVMNPAGNAVTHAVAVPTRADTNPVVVKKVGHAAWNPQTITRMLKNPTYKGLWQYNKTKLVKRLTADSRETRAQVA